MNLKIDQRVMDHGTMGSEGRGWLQIWFTSFEKLCNLPCLKSQTGDSGINQITTEYEFKIQLTVYIT